VKSVEQPGPLNPPELTIGKTERIELAGGDHTVLARRKFRDAVKVLRLSGALFRDRRSNKRPAWPVHPQNETFESKETHRRE
jgi:hypothetical protein